MTWQRVTVVSPVWKPSRKSSLFRVWFKQGVIRDTH